MKTIMINILLAILLCSGGDTWAQSHAKPKPRIRVYDRKEFAILDSLRIIVYSRNERVTVQKKMPETHYETFYYFSKTIDSDILMLTGLNVEKAFPDDHKMHDSLMKSFPDDMGITEYDNFHKTFKINRFLDQNLSINK